MLQTKLEAIRRRFMTFYLGFLFAVVLGYAVNEAQAPIRYRLGSGDSVDLTAVEKLNQGAGSGLDADTVDGKHAPTTAIVGVDDTQTLKNKTIDGTLNTLANIGSSSLTNASVKDNHIAWGSGAGQVNTDDLPEGTGNKYFSGKTTDNLPEGTTNKYFSGKTTDNLPEGTTNKYNPFGISVDSAEITDGTIANADVSGTAAIARSKLDFGTGLTNTDVSATAGIAESKLSLNFPTHSNANDPSSGEKSALAGTSGVPSATNKYITDADVRNTNARTPTAHAPTHGSAGSDAITIAESQITDGALLARVGSAETLANNWSFGKTGTATSTLTQKDSYTLSFTGSSWNGTAEATHDFKFKNVASTTANEDGRLAFFWDTSELMSLTKGGILGLGAEGTKGKLHITGGFKEHIALTRTGTVSGHLTISSDGHFGIVPDTSTTPHFAVSFNTLQASVGGTWPTGQDSVFHIEGSAISRRNLVMKAFGGQTVPFQEWRDSAGSTSGVIDINGNIGIGTATFGTNAAKVLGIKNGTAPTTSPADMVQLYAEDAALSSELKVRDEAGNVTTLSPHPADYLNTAPNDQAHTVPWGYHSKNDYLGKEIFVDLALLAEEVQRLSGKQIITVKDIPKQSWADNQENMRLAKEKEIQDAQARVASIQAEIDAETDLERKATLVRERDAVIVPTAYTKKSPPAWLAVRGVR